MRRFQRCNPFRHPRSRELITDFFNRNYNFVMEITILPLFQKLEFLGSYTYSCAISDMSREMMKMDGRDNAECQNWEKKNINVIF